MQHPVAISTCVLINSTVSYAIVAHKTIELMKTHLRGPGKRCAQGKGGDKGEKRIARRRNKLLSQLSLTVQAQCDFDFEFKVLKTDLTYSIRVHAYNAGYVPKMRIFSPQNTARFSDALTNIQNETLLPERHFMTSQQCDGLLPSSCAPGIVTARYCTVLPSPSPADNTRILNKTRTSCTLLIVVAPN